MATINSQLSITNVGLDSSATTSESENKSGFLAVFESVQNEVQSKHASADEEQNSRDDSQLSDENDTPKQIDDSENATDEGEQTESAVANIDKSPTQDDMPVTRSSEFKQLDDSANTNKGDSESTPVKSMPVDETKPVAKQTETQQAQTEQTQKATSNNNNTAISLLEQLTKSKSFDVSISKGSESTEQAQSVKAPVDSGNAGESTSVKDGATKVNLTQNLVSLDNEFAKLDKEGLETLKQFFTQLDNERELPQGLSKHDLRLVMDKLNVAIAKADSKAKEQSVTLQSVLASQSAKPNTEQQTVEQNATPDDFATDSDNDQAKLQSTLASRPLGEAVPVANKQQTITRPDAQVPHNVTAVAKAVAQEQNVDLDVQQTTAELINQQATKPSPASVVSLSSQAAEKLQASNEQTSNAKQSNVKVDTTQLVDEQNVETEASTEQSQSFAKLLNSLKTNANTPVLSQLVSQLQASQLQQAEVSEINQQHLAMQTAQVIQNTKKTTISADQALQQPVNIAKSDAAKALFNKANMLLNLNLKEAEIRLDPPELGSMQIRIRSDAEQAQINFVVQSQQAKDVLEQSMGRLKEMLAEQGINLGESSVSEQGQGEQQMAGQSGHSSSSEHEPVSNVSEQIVSKQQDGIDFYA
ncbi:Flagellar hook-length control protein [Pseudoalteromonas sp. P1-9]|uniref:flagellar hook-length control protein FliK n=1 Tax=Pseudoalteromonas sp. P1-9 TaxID=1710354 RepID=UPI0006D5DC07|nr:flagellar hook-length control protein FliK [Pseudoalteromonas sp. P1-9]KPV97577.1 Flagellar hook-length control protein [Pseudoalteromonas sp. P1-9]